MTSLPSPLQTLHAQITAFFSAGNEKASLHFVALLSAARAGSVNITPSFMPFKTAELQEVKCHIWDNCKQTATLVLLLATASECLEAATVFYFNPSTREGIPRLAEIQARPSASLRAVVEKAVDAALIRREVTVLGVDQVDMEILERSEKGEATHFQSFGHTFVVGVGPEGAM
ncbi:MAG: hypothetical protein Q9187_009085, partial [Circinaria calcarea]